MTYNYGSMALTGQREPEQVRSLKVSANLLSTLGIAPVRGRTFRDEEEPKSGPPVAMITETFSRTHFPSYDAALGQTLTLNDTVFTIVGIVPDRFQFGRPFDVMTPLRLTSPSHLNYLTVIARIAPGMNVGQARSALKGVLPAYQKDDSDVSSLAIAPY